MVEVENKHADQVIIKKEKFKLMLQNLIEPPMLKMIRLLRRHMMQLILANLE